MTNQWHFYVVTNPVGGAADVTNAAFITFLPDTLSIPRMGVFADSTANATVPEADIDLYVTHGFDADESESGGDFQLRPRHTGRTVSGRRLQRRVPQPRRHGVRRGYRFHTRPGLLRRREVRRPRWRRNMTFCPSSPRPRSARCKTAIKSSTGSSFRSTFPTAVRRIRASLTFSGWPFFR